MENLEEPDMIKRDPNNLNEHVKVEFVDVLGEPDSAHSPDGFWQYSYRCYTYTLRYCYWAHPLFCALPLAFWWACSFGCTACTNVWFLTPCIHCLTIYLKAVKKLVAALMDAILGPCCETSSVYLVKGTN